MADAISAPRFEMRRVGKRFGATVALDGVDLSVNGGEVCALVGQNGAGKSTLMAILAGALAPDSGTMRLDGAAYAPRDPLDARRAGVAMIYQELSLAPHLSVMENIVLGVEPVRRGVVQRERMRASAVAALRELRQDDLAPETMVGDLAPAAQQLVEIARALAVGCRVLVLDEPTSSLGQSDVRALFDVIGRLKARGIAIVYISHFIEEVQSVSDRFVVLRDGRNAGAGVSAAASAADIVGLMIGRPLDDLYPRRVRRPGEPVLQLDGVVSGRSTREPSRSVTTDHSTRESSSSHATSGATLTLRRGEVLGIAGLLGAGRTCLLRAIFGLEPVMRGAVRVGAFSGAATPHERWRQGVGLLSEERAGEGLALGLTLADNMTLTRLEGFGPLCTVLPARQERAVARLIDRLGIRCAGARQPAGELSGGNQQKVAVARLLHHGVDVFVLDEPTRGIDVASKAQIYTLVDELVAQQKAVLLVSSYFPELLGVCDRIAVMSRGELGPARPVEEWTEHSLLMAASGARAAS